MARGEPEVGVPNWLTSCRAVVDSVGDQVMVVGRDYQIMMVNSAFLEGAGLPECEVVGRRCYQVTHHSDRPCSMTGEGCPLAAVLETGKAVSVEHVHFDGASHQRRVDIVGAPVRDAAGQVVGMVESIRDVTRQKQLEAALVQRNAELEAARRNREQFTSTVCHELKNILNGLSLHAQLLKSDQPHDRQLHAERVVTGARRLARLVEDMRDAASIESQRFTVERSRCDLGLVAREAAGEGQLVSPEHRFVVEAPDRPVEGAWDAARLRQVLDNLVSNATKFSPPGGEVRLVVRREAPRAWVSIHDAGRGIPAAKLAGLFQPYVRAHADVPGMGLGLFVCRGIVEAHGGEIRAESVEGRGSSFSFWLPLDVPR